MPVSAVRSSLAFSFVEKYSVLLINIAATIVLARLLTPAETGLYSVAAGIVNVAQTLRDFGVGNYIIQETDLTRRRLSTSLGISVLLGAIMAGLFVASAGPLARTFNEPRLKTVILILSLNFILVAFAAIGTARLHRDMNFRAALRIGIVAAATHAGTSILMASLGYGAIGMAWASVAGICVFLIGNYVCYAEDVLLMPGFAEWRRILGFGVLASGGYILQEVGQRAADVIVGRFLGFGAAGMFSRANGLVGLFQQALMNAIAPVVLGAMALIKRKEQDLIVPFLHFLSFTTAVAWPLLGIMALLAMPIIEVAFGPQWLPAVRSAQILCVAAGIAVLGRVAITLFTATGAARRLFHVQLVAIPILVGAVALGASLSIEAAAAGTAAGSLAHAVYALHQVNRSIGTGWRQLCRALLASLLVTAASLALPVGILVEWGLRPDRFWPQTIAAGGLGAISWVTCILAMRHPLGDELKAALGPILARVTSVFAASPDRATFPVEGFLSLRAGRGPVLTVVVDAEEEFAWDRAFDAAATSVDNLRWTALAQDVFDAYGVVPTYAIDYPVATSPQALGILKEIADSGRCEIGAHLHPWVNPPHDCPVDNRHSYPGNLAPELEHDKLRVLTEAIAAGFGRRPTLYKAGRYGVGPRTVGILPELGYELDVSVVPYTDFSSRSGPDFRSFSAMPFLTRHDVVVLPLSVGFVGALSWSGRYLYPALTGRVGMRLRLPSLASRLGLIERIRLSPEGHCLNDLIKMTRAALPRGRRFFMLTYHSSSLLPGATPYVQTEQDRQAFIATLTGYLDFFMGDCSGRSAALSEIKDHLRHD